MNQDNTTQQETVVVDITSESIDEYARTLAILALES
jgi:hypothetical protein